MIHRVVSPRIAPVAGVAGIVGTAQRSIVSSLVGSSCTRSVPGSGGVCVWSPSTTSSMTSSTIPSITSSLSSVTLSTVSSITSSTIASISMPRTIAASLCTSAAADDDTVDDVPVYDVGSDVNSHIQMVALKPREIVAELDRHIIGQADAKRAISIALRNRWRRMQLDKDMQTEVIPKNILMVGPTGVGKTEIARRLAKLARAPFVKVEATKFTEVGYHGRDVDTIIRDLLEAAMTLTREIKTEEFRESVKPIVEHRILEAMTGPDARQDTVESFRELLRSGEMDDREIQIDVPAMQGGGSPFGPDIEMNVSGASFDLSDLMTRLGANKSKARMEKRRMKVKDCRRVLEEYELEKKLNTLDMKKEAIELAEQNGIVVIDEIDKIVSDKRKYSGDASSEGVQRDLLPMIEGCSVDVKRFGPVKTDYILFVAAGAFHDTKPSEMLAELQGRLPIRVELQGLDADDLIRILNEPEANLIDQQVALIGAEGVKLSFTEEAVSEIGRTAANINRTIENIGARRLHTVLERIMEDISYEACDMESGSEVVIDVEDVKSKLGDLLEKTDIKKFIL